MGRQKGTIKTGGRVKGTPNQTSANLKEAIFKLIKNNMDTLDEDLKTLEADKRIDVVIKLLPYAVPKVLPVQEEIQNEQESDSPKVILMRKLSEMSEKNNG